MIDFLVTCGSGVDIPDVLPNLVHYIVVFIKIIVPIVLIVLGMLDMGRAVIGKDDKEMKESQNRLIHRVVYAILIFLIVSIVTWVVSIVSKASNDDDAINKNNISQCVNCFINGTDSKGCK